MPGKDPGKKLSMCCDLSQRINTGYFIYEFISYIGSQKKGLTNPHRDGLSLRGLKEKGRILSVRKE